MWVCHAPGYSGVRIRVRNGQDHVIISSIDLTIRIGHGKVNIDRLARFWNSIILERDRRLTILIPRCDRNSCIRERCVIPVLELILGTRDLVIAICGRPAGIGIDMCYDLILRCVPNTIAGIIIKIDPHRVAFAVLCCRWGQLRKTKVGHSIIIRDGPGIDISERGMFL